MPRKSVLSNFTLLSEAASQSQSISEALQKLGLRAAGGNFRAFRKACEAAGIAVPVAVNYRSTIAARLANTYTDDEVFVEDSTYNNRSSLKSRLFTMGVPNVCNKCGQEPWWNGAPLVLTLEHKNGIWNDNRLENLEILCGHCHSQTATFAGRSSFQPKTRPVEKNKPCVDCGIEILNTSIRCRKCDGALRGIVDYPPLEELVGMVLKSNLVQVGKSLGVSDNSLRKHLYKNNVDVRALTQQRRLVTKTR